MHPRSLLKLLLAVVFAVSLSVVDQTTHTHLMASPDTSPSGTPPPDQTWARPIRRGRARLSGVKHSRERDRAAIQYHYDVGDEFYYDHCISGVNEEGAE